MESRQTVYVIACGVLGPEIKELAGELGLALRLEFLPGKLHNRPDILRQYLQEAIDKATADPDCIRIVVGYGLCGKGTVGVKAGRVPLVFPKAHDCIALFLGSDRAYREQFAKYPGTYYFTEGWQDEKEKGWKSKEKSVWVGDRSVGCAELEEKYGKERGEKVIDFFSSWTSNYQRAAYIDTGVSARDKSLTEAKEMAKEHNWQFQRLPGDLSLLRKLLSSSASDDDIVIIPPQHQTIYSAEGNCLKGAPMVNGESGEDGEGSGTGKLGGKRQFVVDGLPVEGRRKNGVRYGLGVDAGGTYTDGVVYDFKEEKILVKSKSLTTKWDFSIGINNCLQKLDAELLQKVEFVSVSTTLATNAIVEGEGQKVGLLLMGGVLQDHNDRLNHSPQTFIKGHINIRGVESEPVDPEQVRRVVQQMVESDGVTAFAVSGYGGSINPLHEQQVRDIIVEETGLVVCCGHQFSSQLNLITRAQTAIVNGRVIPRMISFFDDLDRVLHDYDIDVPVMVVKGDGTLISRKAAALKPVETVFSGPAASVAGARRLTGVENGMVLDIGGTTTDTADIAGGEVAVSPEGAVVGNIKTHVRALKMKTVGLGGDSHIRLKDGLFSLGPRRVAPLVWADAKGAGGVDSALTAIGAGSVQNLEQSVLVALEGKFSFSPTPTEERAYQLLLKGCKTPEQLAGELDIISSRLLRIERLEQAGLVQRCGLTPTDLLHSKNLFSRWPAGPARRMLEILSAVVKKDIRQLTEELLQLVHYKLAEELVHNGLFGDFSRGELENSPVYKHISDALLGRKKLRYGLQAAFDHPVIGIGAPASFFLPKAAEMLGTRVLIPEDGDVANALGAVTSHVLVRKNLVIRPDSQGRYVVEGVVDNPSFVSIDGAEEWVVSYLIESVRESAREAGTSEEAIAFDVEDSLVSLKDGTLMLLERNIIAQLKGNPDLALAVDPLTS